MRADCWLLDNVLCVLSSLLVVLKKSLARQLSLQRRCCEMPSSGPCRFGQTVNPCGSCNHSLAVVTYGPGSVSERRTWRHDEQPHPPQPCLVHQAPQVLRQLLAGNGGPVAFGIVIYTVHLLKPAVVWGCSSSSTTRGEQGWVMGRWRGALQAMCQTAVTA